jgi:MFS family permease
MFQAGRFVSGCGIGVLVTVCPMYLSEMSSPFRRGWLVGHHAIFLVFGYMFSSWIGYGCYFATQLNPSLPRSPRWLISKGLKEEAFDVIKKMRMSPHDPEHRVARDEFYQTEQQLKLEAEKLAASGNSIWTMAWKKKSYRKRLAIGFMTQWGAEFAGPLIINNYAVILYTNLGETGHMPLLLSALWLTTAGLIYNPLGAWLHDQVKSRRGMYLVGLAGCLVTTSLLAAMTALYSGTSNRAGNAMGIFFIFLYLAFQGTCCDTTMYIYVSEIFPTELRPVGMGFSLFGQFAASLILLQTAPIGFAEVGWKYYLVIICWCIVYIPRMSAILMRSQLLTRDSGILFLARNRWVEPGGGGPEIWRRSYSAHLRCERRQHDDTKRGWEGLWLWYALKIRK